MVLSACAHGAAPKPPKAAATGTLYYLGAGKVFSLSPDGGTPKVIVDETEGGRAPGLNDGIALDVAHNAIYWTNMGKASADDGWVSRANLDGTNKYRVVESGGAFTPKQMKLDLKHGKMYWADREGMSIRRANLDGSNIELVVGVGDPKRQAGDQTLWCVGIALDVDHGMLYWTQKGGDNAGQGLIRRAPMEVARRDSPYNRHDIETLFSRLPEPIDLDLDLKTRTMYWTDRGDNTVSRAPMDPPRDYDPAKRFDRQILVRGLKEAIGVALDLKHNRMAYTDLGGDVGLAKLDGSDAHMLATEQGLLTGIVWGE
ncbi:MAG: 3-hydroxyacyl-CoA dehydrogenase [Alphaproteobacteria bacterium]|nr:3-hydroxyacyl-CoA dehydrogenase [Alphaproteobacteria bacterium]